MRCLHRGCSALLNNATVSFLFITQSLPSVVVICSNTSGSIMITFVHLMLQLIRYKSPHIHYSKLNKAERSNIYILYSFAILRAILWLHCFIVLHLKIDEVILKWIVVQVHLLVFPLIDYVGMTSMHVILVPRVESLGNLEVG